MSLPIYGAEWRMSFLIHQKRRASRRFERSELYRPRGCGTKNVSGRLLNVLKQPSECRVKRGLREKRTGESQKECIQVRSFSEKNMEYTAFSRNKHIRNPPLETLWRSPFSGICYFCASALSAEHISRGATPGLRTVCMLWAASAAQRFRNLFFFNLRCNYYFWLSNCEGVHVAAAYFISAAWRQHASYYGILSISVSRGFLRYYFISGKVICTKFRTLQQIFGAQCAKVENRIDVLPKITKKWTPEGLLYADWFFSAV